MTIKRFFISIVACIMFCIGSGFAQDNLDATIPRVPKSHFPVSVQFTPVPSGNGWHNERPPLTKDIIRENIHNIILHGCTNICTGAYSNRGGSYVLDYAQSLGMQIDYTTHGVQIFKRNEPAGLCVYSPEYMDSVRALIQPVLGGVKKLTAPHSLFPYIDEPFHADTTMFDYREPVRKAFQKKYGYKMPLSCAEAKRDPKKHLDFINFQSSIYTEAWRKIYKEVKNFDSRPLVVLTHDSHNTMGGGVHSDSKYAVDDIFHWGGDFADMFLYDIYPYTMFDYRYGEYSQIPKPRISQMHYTMAQMRNLTTTYGKKLGFWLGTYNEGWFRRYLTNEMRNQYWMERELAYTAIGGGSDFIITGINIPSEARHWEDFGRAMRVLQKEGGQILESPKPKARACFLFPRTQHIQLQEECFNVGLTFELCLRAFGELDIIHEEQIVDDKMNGYDILVMADVKMLPREVADNIIRFVKRGGKVIADCVPQMDAYMKPLENMKELFGVQSASTNRVLQLGTWNPLTMYPARWAFRKTPPPAPVKTFALAAGKAFDSDISFRIVTPRNCVASDATIEASMASGSPLLLSHQVGKGVCYLFGFCLQDTYFQTWKDEDEVSRAELHQLVHNVFDATGVHSRVYSSNPDMEVAIRRNNNAVYVFVINHEAKDDQTEIDLRDIGFEVGQVLDMDWNRPYPFIRTENGIKLTARAMEGSAQGITLLLKVTPKE